MGSLQDERLGRAVLVDCQAGDDGLASLRWSACPNVVDGWIGVLWTRVVCGPVARGVRSAAIHPSTSTIHLVRTLTYVVLAARASWTVNAIARTRRRTVCMVCSAMQWQCARMNGQIRCERRQSVTRINASCATLPGLQSEMAPAECPNEAMLSGSPLQDQGYRTRQRLKEAKS